MLIKHLNCKTVLLPSCFARVFAFGVALAAPFLIATAATQPSVVPQTLTNVAYGSHPRQVLDFWKAKSDNLTPLVFFIHGGGWRGGNKGRITDVETYLNAGISVVSINYRLVTDAGDVKPPVKCPLDDAARALQFVRSKAVEWNLDKKRIGASGGSAGACSSLWLAFHNDMADPSSVDPVSRESTRLWCAAVRVAQTTLDPKQMKEWIPNSVYGGHAFGFTGDKEKNQTQFEEFLEKREQILPWLAEYSPYNLVTPDDPPVYLWYSRPPTFGKPEKDPTHSADFGVGLSGALRKAGVEYELVYPGAPEVRHPTIPEYLIETLKAPGDTAKKRK
jgi:acetyl esterase/lipase